MITCEVCGEKPAKIHSTKIVNGEAITTHLCQECARKQSLGGQNPSISNIFSGIFNLEAATLKVPQKEDLITCESCNQTYRSFKESGRLGCPDCYDTFEELLLPLLNKVQKGNQHKGKHPHGIPQPSREDQLAGLRRDLQKAVEKEEFEQAATLRDEIRRLECEDQNETY